MGQKVKRRERRQDKAEERLMSVSTPKQIRREARASTRAQYAPLTREVKAEKRASRLQQKRISQYFPQYDDELDKAAASSNYATQGAISQINSASQSGAAYAEQLRAKLAAEDQASAASRGVTYDSSGSQTNAAAQLARINAANVLTGVTAGQGAVNQRYIADKKAIGKREETEQHLREATRKRSYDKALRDIAKDKGAYKSAKLAEIKDRERDFLLSQQAASFDRRSTRKAQALDARAQAESARHNRASERTSRRNAATSARNADLSAQRAAETARNNRANRRNTRADNRRADRTARETRRHNRAMERDDSSSNVDNADVQRAGVLIRTTPPGFFRSHSQNEIIDAIMAKDQTISRKEATKAYRRNLAYIQQQAAGG